nr:helix-hairpin-helix domain-containing protein [Amycolatopsis nigrescens]
MAEAARSGAPPPPPRPVPPSGAVGRLMSRWLPAGLTGAAPAVRRRLAVLAVLAGVVVLVTTTILLLGGSPAPERPPPLPVARADTAPAAAVDKAPAGPLVVSVVGKVSSPGLVTVPAGARVADAVRAAGGATPGTDLTTLNLARRVADGEQVAVGVPAPPDALPGGAAQSGAGAGPAGKIDLNTATVAQLDTLPGIGAVTAQRIVDWRAQHGGFASVEQLRDVDGIGETRFSKLREQVRVS